MYDLRSLTLAELEEAVVAMGEAKFRAVQIFKWLHQKYADSFSEMTNVSLQLREQLQNKFCITPVMLVEETKSNENIVAKYLFSVPKNNIIESVFMKYSYGNALCISTQVGCRMGCLFCASGALGLERGLSAGEMCAQIYKVGQQLGEKISNVILMGIGEPFDNFAEVMKFLNIIGHKDGLGLGARQITISTCGLVDKIEAFARVKSQVNLAVSLHASNDDIRHQIMPITKRYPINAVIDACKAYSEVTRRRVTYEYALIAGLNDSAGCAKELAGLIKGNLCHVNLIPLNAAKGQYSASKSHVVKQFAQVLQNSGIKCTIRRSLGTDILAACGQLRRNYIGD